jgi:hypothetical protein
MQTNLSQKTKKDNAKQSLTRIVLGQDESDTVWLISVLQAKAAP